MQKDFQTNDGHVVCVWAEFGQMHLQVCNESGAVDINLNPLDAARLVALLGEAMEVSQTSPVTRRFSDMARDRMNLRDTDPAYIAMRKQQRAILRDLMYGDEKGSRQVFYKGTQPPFDNCQCPDCLAARRGELVQGTIQPPGLLLEGYKSMSREMIEVVRMPSVITEKDIRADEASMAVAAAMNERVAEVLPSEETCRYCRRTLPIGRLIEKDGKWECDGECS